MTDVKLCVLRWHFKGGKSAFHDQTIGDASAEELMNLKSKRCIASVERFVVSLDHNHKPARIARDELHDERIERNKEIRCYLVKYRRSLRSPMSVHREFLPRRVAKDFAKDLRKKGYLVEIAEYSLRLSESAELKPIQSQAVEDKRESPLDDYATRAITAIDRLRCAIDTEAEPLELLRHADDQDRKRIIGKIRQTLLEVFEMFPS